MGRIRPVVRREREGLRELTQQPIKIVPSSILHPTPRLQSKLVEQLSMMEQKSPSFRNLKSSYVIACT
ncbi:hypothetical protein LINPERPRIM_LOCUS38908 [Linum perenne]